MSSVPSSGPSRSHGGDPPQSPEGDNALMLVPRRKEERIKVPFQQGC
ncbi:uncharacterized protein G2W53_013308 [Senna tora]|uniref:Uncharacterized protein n=1 Tax=Senna tora TaxID=362788 RepID=A0A834WPC0_9FABA|nr:uncharacterized protein G2W53_013308 [Senna tora]